MTIFEITQDFRSIIISNIQYILPINVVVFALWLLRFSITRANAIIIGAAISFKQLEYYKKSALQQWRTHPKRTELMLYYLLSAVAVVLLLVSYKFFQILQP